MSIYPSGTSRYGINPYYYPPHNYSRIKCISKGQLRLINLIRMLWEQHTVWTKMTIMSIVQDLPNESFVTERLLQNPKDFGKALEPFYGAKIASKFSDLLTEHLVIAAELVKASKAGDNIAAEELERSWYNNADNIALLLGSINPYWSAEEWRSLLHHHLSLVKAEAIAFLNEDFEATVQLYDELERQALEMADVMAKGIIKQFPKMTL